MEGLIQDVRFAFRTLLKNPAFAAIAILTLALGIGGISTIFTVVNGVLLRPLPYGDSDGIAMVYQSNIGMDRADRMIPSPANFRDWKEQNQVFEDILGYRSTSLTWIGEGEPETISVTQATPNLLAVLKVDPIIGRAFTAEDTNGDSAAVALISNGLWKRRFAGDPQILGKELKFEDRILTVVGVMPPSFQFPIVSSGPAADLWTPLPPGTQGFFLRLAARLKTGMTRDAAQRGMDALTQRLEQERPAVNKNIRANVVLMKEAIIGRSRSMVWLF
ncbi:MAG: ABC transporter permease, partial [Acidobacteria bacterium]|nr:ABC transporter permease [Acidobacteriota bacterium]